MTDPTWTPDAAYQVLRRAIDRFLDARWSATQLYDWLTGTYGTPPGTPREHRANQLWRQTLLNVAVFLQCDMERSMLEESLRLLVDGFDLGEFVGFTAITRSSCFVELMRTEQIPAPLINVTKRNLRMAWEAEGFREL